LGTASDQVVEEARARLDAGEYEQALEAALAALDDRPADAVLLRVAGKASVELDRDGGVALLERAVAADAQDAEAWRDLGEALVFDGRVAEAGDALRRAVELRPDDVAALVDLGHVELAAGRADEAAARFRQAVERSPENAQALRALGDVLRRQGRLDDALGVAVAASAASPDDVVAALDVADLSLELDRLDDAAEAFRRVRAADDDPEHEVFAQHGLIEVEVRRGEWRRALDLAVDATRVDRLGRTTDVLAFAVARVFGEADRPAPTRAEVDEALARSRAEHRRLHLETTGTEGLGR
jgi:tetratricopeptide (TPR) repeat protein